MWNVSESQVVRRQARGLVIVLVGLAVAGLVPLWAEPPPLVRAVDCSRGITVGGRLWCEEGPLPDLVALCRRVGLPVPVAALPLRPGDAVDPIASCLSGRPPGRMAPAALRALALPVDVNTASEGELSSLPGVGPVTARRIVEGRPFSGVGDLIRVKGIGPKRLARLRERARVR